MRKLCLVMWLAAGCDGDPNVDASTTDAAVDAADPVDAFALPDAPADAFEETDAFVPPDVSVDAPVDAPIDAPVDAPIDAPIDVPIDAGPSCSPGDDCVPDALVGGLHTARAVCSGSATFYSPCSSGCCSSSSSLSELSASLEFEIVDDAMGRRLHVTSVTVDGGTPQPRDAWSAPASGAVFRIDAFSARLTGTFSGPLLTANPDSGFELRFRGSMTVGGGVCPGTESTRTCVFRPD